MIVFDLACEHQHLFEGWFASADDFVQQKSRGLVACPACSSKSVEKRLSAPRLNLGAHEPPEKPGQTIAAQQGTSDTVVPPRDMVVARGERAKQAVTKLQNAWMEMAKELIATTEDVGDDFAAEARRMHYGEAPERGIRGQVSTDEAEALVDEGIPVASFPMPAALKGPLQ